MGFDLLEDLLHRRSRSDDAGASRNGHPLREPVEWSAGGF